MSSILLLHADPAASARLCAAFSTDASLAVQAIAANLAQARAAIAARIPDLLIAGLRLPDGPLTALLDELRPGRSHVMVSVATLHDPHLLAALQRGADAYLLDGQPAPALLEAVRRLLASESPLAPEIARQVLAHYDIHATPPMAGQPVRHALTVAEQRLLQWSGEGFMPAEIGRRLGLTPQQVGLLTHAVYRRLQLEYRAPGAAGRSAAAARPRARWNAASRLL